LAPLQLLPYMHCSTSVFVPEPEREELQYAAPPAPLPDVRRRKGGEKFGSYEQRMNSNSKSNISCVSQSGSRAERYQIRPKTITRYILGSFPCFIIF
jgi:hypothetical protein